MTHLQNQPQIPSDRHDELLAMYEDGKPYRDIAAHFGVSNASVRRALTRAGAFDDGLTRYQQNKEPEPAPAPVTFKERYNGIRFTDDHRDLTACLMGDPTPARLKHIHGRELVD